MTRDGHQTGPFDHFRAPDGSPIGYTGPLETPNGAFSFDEVMYVFAGIAAERWSHIVRPENPTYGAYLFSKRDPGQAGPWNVEFLVSPRLGWCARDETRSSFDSHDVRGMLYVAGRDIESTPGRLGGFRCCRRCGAVYHAAGGAGGACQRGGPHEPDPAVPEALSFEIGDSADEQHQSNWHVCQACLALYWAGDPAHGGLCPAVGRHEPSDPVLRVPHASVLDGGTLQAHWRFCVKCSSLYWNGDGDGAGGVCPQDRQAHQGAGFDFLLRHDGPEVDGQQGGWRLCGQCGALYAERAPATACPIGPGGHVAVGWEFVLDVAAPETLTVQPHWHRCARCAGLFFDGYPDKGSCPGDSDGHVADHSSPELQLTHNPGVDVSNRGDLQCCVRCRELVRTDQPKAFPWVAPVVVDNVRHAVLAAADGNGLVMIGFDWRNFRLAWMPLTAGAPPRPDAIRYYHAAKRTWSDEIDDSAGYELFAHSLPGQYTHVSALWVEPPGCWVVAYARAWDITGRFDEPIVARFSTDLVTWSTELPLFHPRNDGAYGTWMHDPGFDVIHPNMPPAQPPGQDNPGWAYGAFLLQRFTTYDPASRLLDLHYVMSTGSPYQVHLMHTVVRLPDPIVV